MSFIFAKNSSILQKVRTLYLRTINQSSEVFPLIEYSVLLRLLNLKEKKNRNGRGGGERWTKVSEVKKQKSYQMKFHQVGTRK